MNGHSNIEHSEVTNNKVTNLMVTVFDGNVAPRTIRLDDYNASEIYFGRDYKNDIVLSSHLVSAEHGRFIYNNHSWIIEDKLMYEKRGSTNGLIYNNASITSRVISDGDFIRIDDGIETILEGVLFVFSSSESDNKWNYIQLAGKQSLTIGRSHGCDIVLPHVSVSNLHARIVCEKDGFYIIDTGSANGIIVNNNRIRGKVKLHEKDVIVITNSKLIFTTSRIYYCYYKDGISVDAFDVMIERRDEKGKKKTTCNHVNLGIEPGELVAIVGGSGAGKSTILNCMCGYLKPDKGAVYINGIDLYHNFSSLKRLIGYVPQADIVYDNLTLYDMLRYTAKLRLPNDITPEETEDAIDRAIVMVELQEKRNSLIRSLSGGQRKRASIAVELLSDPNLLFLDEPASGLDPGTERNLMQSLRKMADNGKTVVLVTHSTLQLKMCDKIVFMGNGGNLCYYGPYDEALKFFGVSDVVDVYNMITGQALLWSEKFDESRSAPTLKQHSATISGEARKSRFRQIIVLSSRYIKLVANDKQRLLLLLVQAPLLAALISLVADGTQFEQYDMTKSLLFALSCSAFWVGMLNAIQEICKERTILKREYMTGLSLGAYVLSKIIVLGIVCLVQSLSIVVVFYLLIGLPKSGFFTNSFVEVLLTTYLTSVASSAMGLFVSSLFTNPDRAMTVAPILLMPQILFSGLIFKLNGATEIISWLALSRWSMEAYGTTANLNELPLKLQQEGLMIPHEAESFFDYTADHLAQSWGILILFIIVFLIAARAVLISIGKEQG